MFDPGPRLRCVASLLQAHRKTVDIGTDHAYLPAYLVLTGKSEDILACDIGVSPLENAAKTVKAYSLESNIKLRISDGLKDVLSEEAEEISICGMGGTLMTEILSAAPWIKKHGMHLVLQPMTHAEDVREYLDKTGFFIAEERYVCENSKDYCVISAFFDGENPRCEDGFYYFGFLPPENDVHSRFIRSRLERLEKKLNALTENGKQETEVRKLKYIYEYYQKRCSDENK